MNKRDYPLFLIDRSCAANYPFNYITCFDKTVGFVARVVHFPADAQYFEFVKTASQIEHAEYMNVMFKAKRGGVILVCEDFLYNFELTSANLKRVQTLLKKALKKFLHAEVERTPDLKDLDIDNQIIQQQLTIDRAKQMYDELVIRANGESKIADYKIALAEATLDTLKKFRDTQKYYFSALN
jgi:hypothetical protein